MSKLYSKSTRGFYLDSYPESITQPTIPDDVVEITDEEHAELFDAQSNGKIIEPDANGYPVAVDPPSDNRTDDELTDEAFNNSLADPVMYATIQMLEELSGDNDFEENFKNKVKDKIKKDKEEKAL